MKKLLSCVTAVCLGASMAAPMVSNAIFNLQDSDSPALEPFKNTEKYIKIDDRFKDLIFCTTGEIILPWDDAEIEDSVLYSNLSGTEIYALIPRQLRGYKEGEAPAVFNLTEGTTIEQVNTLLSEKFGEEYKISHYYHNINYKYQFDGRKEYFKEVCQLLKDENFIDSFVLPTGFIQIAEYNTDAEENVLQYSYLLEEQYNVLEKYISENNLGELTCLEKNSKTTSYLFEPSEFEAVEEKFDIALDIYKKTGIRPGYFMLEAENITDTNNIDVFNSIDGDANNDKITSIADAAAIMQAIGNPDKYALSMQGEFNADYGCDGITVEDAVAIQKKLANIE